MSEIKDMDKLLKRQIEFYFSDSNLRRDKFLRKKIFESKDYYVSVEMIMNFKKIQQITTDKDKFLDICRNSNTVQLNKDETMIRRNGPYKKKTRYESSICQIYLENIPLETKVEDLEEELQHFGNIQYVKFRKGFPGTAFIEFDTIPEALSASLNETEQKTKYNIQYFPKWLFNNKKQNGTHSYASITKV